MGTLKGLKNTQVPGGCRQQGEVGGSNFATGGRCLEDQPAPDHSRLAPPAQAPSVLLQSVLSDLSGHFFRVPAFPALPIPGASPSRAALASSGHSLWGLPSLYGHMPLA